MPEWFKDYLESLPSSQARPLWEYLDGWPVVAQDMIEVLAESHPGLASRMQK